MGNESGEIITTSLFSLTGIMVSKGNDPQMAQQFRLVNYSNLPRWMEMTHDFPAMLAEAMAARWILAPTFAISSNARSIDSQEDNAGRDNGRPIVAASRSKYVQILRKYQELEELVGVLSFLWFNRSKDPGTIIPIDCGLEVISSYKSYLCSQTKNELLLLYMFHLFLKQPITSQSLLVAQLPLDMLQLPSARICLLKVPAQLDLSVGVPLNHGHVHWWKWESIRQSHILQAIHPLSPTKNELSEKSWGFWGTPFSDYTLTWASIKFCVFFFQATQRSPVPCH